MINFKDFLTEEEFFEKVFHAFEKIPINEGGNVIINDIAAQRVDLKQINRTDAVRSFDTGLRAFSVAFEKFAGIPLWSNELLNSLEYLSGSAKHFFDIDTIATPDFTKVKSSVGDIDTQVDIAAVPIIKKFLQQIKPGTIFGNTLEWVGFKQSADQYITLFKAKDFNDLPVQVDLEHVEFVNGKPTAWSQFSHSSSFADMQERIKGAFHKYLFRSLTAKNELEAIVLTGKRKTPKTIKVAPFSASLKGIRERIQPEIDETTGKQKIENGLPVFVELPSKGAYYHTDMAMIFSILFGQEPNGNDISKMHSFVTMLDLVREKLNTKDQKKIFDRFVEILFGKGAQGMYRGREGRLLDFRDKTTALRMMSSKLGISWKPFLPTIQAYYKNYK